MTISKNILRMSPSEYSAWIAERRRKLPASSAAFKGKKSRRKTVTQLAKELGIDKSKVLEALNED